MKPLKTKLIVRVNEEEFRRELGEFLETDIEGSVQYRTATNANGHVVHSALVIYVEIPKEGEDVES
jgi:hypothetical protein